jgi:hypothetical protein
LSEGQRGLVARVLSSPRRRRRLRIGGALLGLAGVFAFIGVHYSNTGKTAADHFSSEPVQRVAPPPKAARLSGADNESVRDVAALFIDTAVLRRRIDDSWEITTQKLRQGLTRKEWDSGNIPVMPFKADAVSEIKYTLDWSGANLVYLKIAIVPKPTSNVDGQAFDIGLQRQGQPAEHKWLVDYWVPSGTAVPVAGPRARAAGQEALTQPKSRISVAWIFVPVGLFVGLLFGLPVAIFGRQRLRSRRALREYRRERA